MAAAPSRQALPRFHSSTGLRWRFGRMTGVTMLVQMNPLLAQGYSSASQKTRIITESWVGSNMFCPRCGSSHIEHFKNNKPVADFYCPSCGSQFELKSQAGASLERINDGAFTAMIDRITGMDNPDFFFMSYIRKSWTVRDFFFVPKHFFTPEIVEARRPLNPTAHRAGWVGCNILLNKIPATGRIPIIEGGVVNAREAVMKKVNQVERLVVNDMSDRGWLFDVLCCIEKIVGADFTLTQVYAFEAELKARHPDNNNVKAKIRQQLQLLRNRGVIEFVRPGEYRKVL